MTLKIALPSNSPGGLDAELSAHFGHCDVFTLVELEDNQIKEVSVLPNLPHQSGGCLAPVQHLAHNGIKAMIAGGMGLRPLMGFNQAGIDVYFNGGLTKVDEVVYAFIDGKLPMFTQNQTCGGHGGCGGH